MKAMASKIILFIIGSLLSGIANANDYPTLERVDYVLTCMRLAGGQTMDNLYACSCEIDVIAQSVKFDDFTAARTYEVYARMPGEKGGLFRDSPEGDGLKDRLGTARQEAKKRCFIGVKRNDAID
ncbi:MAG: hypothetical protein ACI9BW_004466 [Gammaproteobacteria bacterium]|jgi:hypothetical protein